MSPPIGRESDKFMLRLPDGMREQIKAVAAENKRSMNAEIVARLEKSLREASHPAMIPLRPLTREEIVYHGLVSIEATEEEISAAKRKSDEGAKRMMMTLIHALISEGADVASIISALSEVPIPKPSTD